jgi:5-formyltetrahydrofolate cyclo-ligase
MTDLAAAKQQLRNTMRTLRRAEAPRAAAAAIEAARLLPLARLPAFASFSVYMPLGSEFDPWPLAERLAATGAIIALPCAESPDLPMIFREYDGRETLVDDACGIPAPPKDARVVHPDLVICPLLAFDRRGHRLGQGAGYYDRALADLRTRKQPFVLGLGFAVQEVVEAPADALDQPMDAILTETGYIPVH